MAEELNPFLLKRRPLTKISIVLKTARSILWLATVVTLRTAASEEATHWAYQPLVRPEVPLTTHTNRIRNPIDHFIVAKLEQKNLSLSPEADKRVLLRRACFDLAGLPPSPEEMQAFLMDRAPDAFEGAVDRLLASPRYGERWARHWMDAVHFAETHGHDQDRIRTNAWPYRDYLIQSFNDDKPYSRFVEEQVAGDILFPEDPQATVALGFLAAGPWDESSLRDIREDTIDRQIARYLDRDDIVTTVMQTFASTTIQCARCHNHKFDPIPQTDYYALQAVFAGVDRANRSYDADRSVHERRLALVRQRGRADRDPAWLLSAEVERLVDNFEHSGGEGKLHWKVVPPQTFVSSGGATLTRLKDNSVVASGVRPERDTYTITAVAPGPMITAVRLEVLADETLPKRGPGRQDNGNLHLSEFQFSVFPPGAATQREVSFASASADFNQSGWTIEHALDHNEKTAWGIFPRVGESHHAVFALKEPLALTADSTLVFVLKQLHGDGHLIGRTRLSVTDAQSPVSVTVLPAELERITSVPKSKRTEKEQLALASFVVKESVARELARLPKPSLVYAAASDFEPDGSHKPAGAPRTVHVLKRGDITKPLEVALPGSLSCVKNLSGRFETGESKDEGARRASLARWLTDPVNGLTWRSAVNRVWQHHFGRGLVETPNDFGKMGGTPSHPELLEWLAVWFRDDAKGSLKALHRLIVTSAAYGQRSNGETESWSRGNFGREPDTSTSALQSSNTPAAIDPGNLLLARMNRTRLDSDQVRDAILQISGCLDLRMGGPSDMQFDLQPGHHVTPRVDYGKFNVDSPAARRRSVYRFLFRTLPDPFMDALDCPAGDQLTPVRNSSVTVQQALAMWNDAFVLHYAERFAHRVESMAKTAPEQVALACELALNRPATEAELKDFGEYVGRHGLANFCRVLLNSNEFMFVN